MPLGRLCYSAYLINLNVIKVSTFSQRSPSYMSDTNFILAFLGFLLATFLLSFAASLLIEMPFLKLDKLLLPGGNNSSSTDHHQHHNNNTNQVGLQHVITTTSIISAAAVANKELNVIDFSCSRIMTYE